MNKMIDAVFERGVLRPVEPLQLQEGESVKVVVVRGPSTAAASGWDPAVPVTAMERIASLPREGPDDGASAAREHDRYLYGDLSEFGKGRAK